MDLTTVTDLLALEEQNAPTGRARLTGFDGWREGDAWLGGGSWLYSEPQTSLRRLLDLRSLQWPPLQVDETGIHIAATCTIAELAAVRTPSHWLAAWLIEACCRYLLASFKIWNLATVGGNLCLALPAGSMTSLAAALDGTCTLMTVHGDQRCVPAAKFVTGERQTVLAPGEYLRSVHLPASSLAREAAARQYSLTSLGRSAVVVIAVGGVADSSMALTVTASTRHPVRLQFPDIPTSDALRNELDDAIGAELYLDDVHGGRDWRRHLTYRLAEQVREELATVARLQS